MCPKIEAALTAPHSLEYTYKRSLGPVLSKFFTALRDRKMLGVRRLDGSVLMPPKEYDPDSGESLGEMVEISTQGIVRSWSWVPQPRRQQPLEHPFAYALIQLDGADSSFIHVVDDVSESDMKTGMRVQARWSETTTGAMTDFVFVPDSTQ
jgi:hypothetical protein